MTNSNCRVLALVLLALVVTASQTDAQSIYTPYAFTNFAGMPGGSGNVDGTGSAARFNGPHGVAVDSAGNAYVADSGNDTIRKITPAGVVTTLAGSVGLGSDDGTGLAVDSAGNVYVADTASATIQKITPAGVVTTLAGLEGNHGSADGTGSAAQFWTPVGMALDSAGNVYVADYGSTIRKITPAGVVTTLAGTPGQMGSADGTGSAARFFFPQGVAVDGAGNVYVADTFNFTIRKITAAGVVTTFAGSAGQQGTTDGTGSAARFGGSDRDTIREGPRGLALDSGDNLYVADSYNHTIRKITPDGVVTTLAGSAGQVGSDDGTGSAARFNYPQGVAADSAGNVYVADATIRKITPAGAVTTLAASSSQFGSADGTGSAARFRDLEGVAVDSAGNVYVADTFNSTIRKITFAGLVTTLAGSTGQFGSDDGTGSAARFNYPHGVAADSAGNVYVADSGNDTIRKITPAGAVTTLAGCDTCGTGSTDGTGSAARFGRFCMNSCWGPSGVAVDSAGNVFVADTYSSTIRKITPDGMVTTLAGNPGLFGSADGTGSAARFGGNSYGGLLKGVAVDSVGNVYVADSGNNRITKGTPVLRFETSAGSLTVSSSFFQIRVTGPFGSKVIVERSATLRAWTPVQTNALPSVGLDLSIPLGADQDQFFRARLAP